MSIGTGAAEIEKFAGRYVRSDDLDLAVRVARATQRPLLLFGAPGSGKSTLAKHIAYTENLRYYEHVVTARTSAQDLLWSFDSVRRLGDAQLRSQDLQDEKYVLPGVLWWAFDRASAQDLPRARESYESWNSGKREPGSVVLIDEIDKADPDVPNSLLVPLAGRYFTVTDLREPRMVQESSTPSLIIITSNRERELPPAFERRCVVYELRNHTSEELRLIAEKHFGENPTALLDQLIEELLRAQAQAETDRRRQPSTAEFIDAIRACRGVGVTEPQDADLGPILKMIFEKRSGGGDAGEWLP
ncbi:AAA family ATPase [Lentzea sp. NPDC055074]